MSGRRGGFRHVARVTRWRFQLSTRTHATTDQFQDSGWRADSPTAPLRTLRPREWKRLAFPEAHIFERGTGSLGRDAQPHLTKRKVYRRRIAQNVEHGTVAVDDILQTREIRSEAGLSNVTLASIFW